MRHVLKLALAGCLGLAAALLLACGSGGGANLIPSANAGPLKNDFTAVATAVANHDCAGAQAAIQQARHDLLRLPATVDSGLKARLATGVNHLESLAPQECQQTSTTATTAPTTTSSTTPTQTQSTPTQTQSTPTQTQSTPTQTQSTPTTTAVPPSGGGGAQAPGSGGNGNGGNGGAGSGQ